MKLIFKAKLILQDQRPALAHEHGQGYSPDRSGGRSNPKTDGFASPGLTYPGLVLLGFFPIFFLAWFDFPGFALIDWDVPKTIDYQNFVLKQEAFTITPCLAASVGVSLCFYF